MEKEYYYLSGDQKMGPISLDALKRAGISPSTMVWNNTLPDWVEARTLPELADAFVSASAPPPSYSASPEPSYQSSGSGYDNQVRPPMPDNYLVWAILSTILCCLPLGIVSIINATKVSSTYALGDYAGAQKASDDAKKWAMWGAIIGGVGIVLYIIFIVVLGVAGSLGSF
ncbi:MAG: CD225/dispanin family protein [Tannerella sp.]|jgi:hypothetical protein|nr:CD225/dispanin family protein [Tannerella sp.]